MGVISMRFIILIMFSLSLGTIFQIPFGSSSYNLQYSEIALVIGYLMVFLKAVSTHDNSFKIEKNDINILFIWYICFLYSLSIFYWSEYGISTIPGALSILVGLMTYFLANQYKGNYIKGYIIGNRVFMLSLAIQLFFNGFINSDTSLVGFYAIKEQASTLLGNSNYISIYLSFVFLYEIIAREKKWIIFSVISFIGIFITLSRAAFLSIAISLIVYMILLLFNRKLKKTKSIIILSTMGVSVWYFLNNSTLGMELINGVKYALTSGNTAGRNILWSMAIQQIKDNPFGIGVITNFDPHNLVLKSFRDLGILFGLIYMFILIKPLFSFLNLRVFMYNRRIIAALLAYLSVVVHAMFEIFYFNSSSIIWTALTLFFIKELIRNERQKSNESITKIA